MKEEIRAQLNYLRITPRKMRFIADLIRGSSIEDAEAQLLISPRRAAPMLLKLLRSAIANAKNNHKVSEVKLYVKQIFVNEGPKIKRWTPRSRGSAAEIQKKTSHVAIILGVGEKERRARFVIDRGEEEKKKRKKARETNASEAQEKKDKREKAAKTDEKKGEKADGKPKTNTSGFRKIFQRKSV